MTVDGKPLRGNNPYTAIVFQSFALLPWLTVEENIGLGLDALHAPRDEMRERVKRAVDRVGLEGFEEAYQELQSEKGKNGNIEIHEKETDIFHIMDGSATIIVGGTAIEPKQTRPFQLTAKDIQGGQSYDLKKGDVLVIPAGTPHWFKQVNGSIHYLTIKSIKP